MDPKGDAQVRIAASAAEMGAAAAAAFAGAAQAELASHDTISVILATGNSQLPFVEALSAHGDIPWDRIRVFHMDEYLGMSADHPASFRRWLGEKIVTPFKPLEFFGVEGDHEPIEEELDRYTDLLRRYPPRITVMGIGENGHLAFNDPPADFDEPRDVRVVPLDEICRRQQVGEGHFPTLADTPTEAVSLSVPALIRPPHVLVVVPERRKAAAVLAAFGGPVTPDCPASILQQTPHAQVFLDPESAALLQQA